MTTNDAEIIKTLLNIISKDTDVMQQIGRLVTNRAAERVNEIAEVRKLTDQL